MIWITSPFMTKYEMAKLLGVRADQLSTGENSVIDHDENIIDPLEIARKELKLGVIPLCIKRNLPDGTSEIWRIKEMKICN